MGLLAYHVLSLATPLEMGFWQKKNHHSQDLIYWHEVQMKLLGILSPQLEKLTSLDSYLNPSDLITKTHLFKYTENFTSKNHENFR